MTREDVSKLFPEATDEQITKLLNQNNQEVAKEKEKAESMKNEIEGLKEMAGQLEAIQKEKEELEQSKMSETEKISKEYEKANQKIADLEKSIAIRDQREAAASKFHVTAEQAKQIVKDDGTFDYDILGSIIAEKESAAALAKEQEIANAASNPGGQNNDGGENGKTIASDMAVASAKRAASANEAILKNYRR